MLLETVLAFLSLPAVQLVVVLLAAAVLGAVVRGQVARLGLDTVPLVGVSAWRWSSAAGAVAFWLAVVFLAQLAVAGLPGTEAVLLLLTRVALAGAALLLASWLAQARIVAAEDAEREQRRRAEAERWPLLAAGAAAAVVALAGGSTVLLVVAGLVLLVLVLMTDTPLARGVADGLASLGAGVELRARLQLDAPVELDGRPFRVVQRPGLLTTWLQGEGGERLAVDNQRLLATVGPAERQLPPTSDGQP